MPLRCLDDADRSLDAVALTPVEWAALTVTNRHVRHLKMHCCGSPVVLKTSRLGTRFFAHHALGGCASGDESPEHLHLKMLAITAARTAGWIAEAEVSGSTPGGEPWRADVLATRGKHRVAVEVQWSGQADDETLRRQARYAASGVRGLWLFRRPGFAVDPEVPAVRVRGTLSAGLTVQGLSAGDFLAAVFNHRLRFGMPLGSRQQVIVEGVVAQCWSKSCAALNRAVERIVVGRGEDICIMPVVAFAGHPTVSAAVIAATPSDAPHGQLRLRQGTIEHACFRCKRLLRSYYLGRAPSRSTLTSFTVAIDQNWIDAIDKTPGYARAWRIVPVARDPAIA